MAISFYFQKPYIYFDVLGIDRVLLGIYWVLIFKSSLKKKERKCFIKKLTGIQFFFYIQAS